MSQVDDLPEELLTMILDRLDVRSLASARSVSKKWKTIAEEPKVARKFHVILDHNMSEDEVLSTIATRPSLFGVTMDLLFLNERVLNAMLTHSTLKNLHVVEREAWHPEEPTRDGEGWHGTIYTLYYFIKQHQLEARHQHGVEVGLRWREYWRSRNR